MARSMAIVISSLVLVILCSSFASMPGVDAYTVISRVTNGYGPYVDKVLYQVISQDDEEVLALLDNEIDLIGDEIDPSFLQMLMEASDIEVAEKLRNGYGYMSINCAKYPLNITDFRRALAFALDKEAISDDVWDGLSVPLDSIIPQINELSSEGKLPYTYYEANVALGNQLLDQAGFIDVDSDGFREAPDGSDFDIIVEVAQSSGIAIETGQAVANALTTLSIDAVNQPVDFYEYLTRLYLHGDYDIAFVARSFTDLNVDWIAEEFWSENADVPYHNYPNFRNATFDSWRDQLLHAAAYSDVYEAAIEMQKILVHASPEIVCYENIQLTACRSDKFENLVNDAVDGIPSWWTNQKAGLLSAYGGPFGGTLRWSNSMPIDTFNILVTSSSYTMNVLQELYEPLLRRDPDLKWMNWLAEDYLIETHADNSEVPSGHTRLTFNIVKNATWSDGVPLSAHDVAFTMNYLRGDMSGIGGRAFDDSNLYAAYAPRDYVFIAEFSTESYWHLSKIADIPILPKHQWAPIGDNWNIYNPNYHELITSGPFYISDYVAGEFTELTRNPLYFMTPPTYDGNPIMGYPPSISPSVTPPETDIESINEQFEEIWDTWSEPSFEPDVDPLLERWSATGELDESMVAVNGFPRAIVYLAPWTSYSTIEDMMDINWKMDFKAFKMVQGTIKSAGHFTKLVDSDGIAGIFSDKMKNPIADEFSRIIESPETIPSQSFDMSEFRDVIGSLGSTAIDYTGNGVVVGHIDSGCDFGIEDLQGAFNPGTYDPTGYGLNLATSLGNTSNVADIQGWLDSGNVLTYENASGVFLNVSSWDPLVNNLLSERYLIGDGSEGVPYESRLGFIWLYASAWGIQVGDFMDQMWKDVKLPDTSKITGDYHLGYVFQQRPSGNIPYAKIFAPALVYESATTNEWNLVIDWDGADAWALFWNGAFYYTSINLLNSAETQPIIDRLDFDFTDDMAEETYNMSNPIVAKDLDGNGYVDLSLGALSWCFDQSSFFGNEVVFNGFRSDGNGFCLYFDDGNHGTATAAHVASRGLDTYYDVNNDSYFTMSGIANESEVLSVRALTSGSEIGAYVWACGFDYDEGTSEFYYTGNHMADVVTNSWGWVTEPSSEMSYISLVWTILSVPSYLDGSYPGVLHVFSSGNEGAGYMTVGPPGCSAGVLTVGASTSYQYLEYLYGPEQDIEGMASFSSKGPSFLGYVKPDVLAPGLAAYAHNPLYAQYYQDDWQSEKWSYGDFRNITLFSGTSQSTPVVAGGVALLIEALDTRAIGWTPDKLKIIIQSTSDSLGYDPATQGFGRINIDAACAFAESDAGFIVESSGSFDNIMGILDEYWSIHSGSSGSIIDLTMPSGSLPTGFGDGSLYFGTVFPGDAVSLRQNVYTDASGTMLTDLTGWSTSAYYWRESETYSFDGVTYVYNDTGVSDRGAYGWFNLRTLIGSSNYDAIAASSSYVTIAVSFDDSDISTYGAPWMFLNDWTDNDPADGKPNLWNPSTEQGAELKRLTSANDPSNANFMSYATSLSSLDVALDGDLTLVVHDPIFDSDWSATGHQFKCTVIFWEKASTSIITDSGGSGISTFDWTLNVPADDAGIYQGYLEIFDGSMTIAVPWSYNLVGYLDGAAGDVHTIVSDFGSELTPYDAPTYGCMEEDPDDYDFRSFIIYNPNSDARNLGVRVEWDDLNCDMAVDLFSTDGTLLASNTASTENTTAILTSLPSPYSGYYCMLVHPVSLTGRTQLPVNYSIHVMWYEEIAEPVVYPRYNSNWDSTLYPFTDYDVLNGDHVTLNITFSDLNIANFPEFEIQTTTLTLYSGVFTQMTGDHVIPSASYNPFAGPIDTSQFAWQYVDGIVEGDEVWIEVDFSNGDTDIMVWWADTDNTTWYYHNNLIADQMATGAHPEVGTFVADRGGRLAIGIFDYDLQVGTYTATVDSRVSVIAVSPGRTITYDTYLLGANTTRDIQVVAVTKDGTEYTGDWDDVTFNNYFAPDVTVISPNGGEVWTGIEMISWSTISLNADADITYEISISSDAGLSYMLFASGATTPSLSWDTSVWQFSETYRVKIEALDRGMSGEDESDAVFSAGGLPFQSASPLIFGQPQLNYTYGQTGNELEWTISDLHPLLIQLWVDGTLTSSYAWSTLANVTTVNCDGLLPGSHNYTIYVNDEEGNSARMTSWVNVEGGASPIINSPDDILYQLGTTGHEIVWEPSDIDPSSYTLYVDEAPVYSDIWDGSDIIVGVDGLSVGTYNYTLEVQDSEGNRIADAVWVEVVDDNTAPSVDEPENQTIVKDTSSNKITWTVDDSYPTSFWIYRDGVMILNGTWSPTEITVSIDGLDFGIYNYTLVVSDIGSNNATGTVFVIVIDDTAPEFTLIPVDILFNEGETGYTITWNFTDGNPKDFILFRNGTILGNHEWTSPYSFEYTITVTEYGVYNFTIWVLDTTELSITDTAWVTITDVTPPTLNNPVDITFRVGETGYLINWTPTDNNPFMYSVTRNGTLILNGFWDSGESLVVDLSGLTEGTFVFTMIVYDEAGNFAMDTVIVIVQSPTTTTTDTTTNTTLTDTSTTDTGTTTTDLGEIMMMVSFMITIGSFVVIIVIVILMIRAKR